MSFLEQQLAAMGVDASGTAKVKAVPEELLDEWIDNDGAVPAKFLLHPSARKLGTESDVRALLQKRNSSFAATLDVISFCKLASTIQRKATKRSMAAPGIEEDAGFISQPRDLERWIAAVDACVATPRWSVSDDTPARLSDNLFIGSAAHAKDVEQLKKLGVTAVLNCAPFVSDDPVDAYEASGIAYAACEAEDFDKYPLLELHLDDAHAFVDAQGPSGVTLVHCFAGINRSATLALALHMAMQKQPLLPAVAHAFSLRPFILSNESFRRSLVEFAAQQDLLGDPPHAQVQQASIQVVKSR